MQEELDALTTSSPIHILAVNGTGLEAGLPSFTAGGRNLPVLQETAATPVWTDWAVTYRDVWILDESNRLVAIYNLTTNDLNVAANYDALKALFLAEAND